MINKDTSTTGKKILVLATGNPDKVGEMNELLRDLDWEVRSFKQVAGDHDIAETGITLDENAEIKARFVRELTGYPALADDTGLEVDQLDGQPGVHSARFAGPEADALQNRKKLIKALEHVPDPGQRTARFRTVLVYLDEHGVRKYEGVCEGHITADERGSGGFGYDPLFRPEGYRETFAEMDPLEKNRISHRGKALQQFILDFRK